MTTMGERTDNDKLQLLQLNGELILVRTITPGTVEIHSVPSPESHLCYLDQIQLSQTGGTFNASVQSIVRRSAIITQWIEAHVPNPQTLEQLIDMIKRSGGAYVDCTEQVICSSSVWYPERLLGIAIPGATRTNIVLNAWAKNNPGVHWHKSD